MEGTNLDPSFTTVLPRSFTVDLDLMAASLQRNLELIFPYNRLMQVLKEFGVATAPFPPLFPPLTSASQGSSYFPTIQPMVEEHTWQLYGYVHESCYENEDVARIALVTSDVGVTPFEQVGMTVGNVDDESRTWG